VHLHLQLIAELTLAACSASILPTAVLPVKPNLRTVSLLMSAFPAFKQHIPQPNQYNVVQSCTKPVPPMSPAYTMLPAVLLYPE
jgi:hypothetical protein